MVRDLAPFAGGTAPAAHLVREFLREAITQNARLHRGETAVAWLRRVTDSALRRAASTDRPSPVAERMFADWVIGVLPTLPPRYADLLRRLDVQRQSKATVARELGQRVTTTDVVLHRARHALRRRLLELSEDGRSVTTLSLCPGARRPDATEL